MDRRAFLGTLAGGLLAAPHGAGAQQVTKVYRVGLLTTSPLLVRPPHGLFWREFVPALHDLGYIESLLLRADQVIR